MNSIRKIIPLFSIVIPLFLWESYTVPDPEREMRIRVQPVFGNEKLVLQTKNYTTLNGDSLSVTKLRFYLSGIQLSFTDSSFYTESNSYHLLDAADSSSLQIQLAQVPQKEITSIRFYIGVDSLASVSGALDGDLDPVKGMYWAWNSGYINAKLEGKNVSKCAKDDEFEFHVGGYLPPYQTAREVNLKVSPKQSFGLVLVADVETLFRHISLKENNRVVLPGAAAVKIADDYAHMFRLEN